MTKEKRIRGLVIAGVGLGLCSGLLGCTDSGQTVQDQTAQNQTADENGEAETTVSDDTEEAQRSLFAMDTYMELAAYGENGQEAVDQAAEEIERLDALLSTGDENSEIAKINKNGGGTVSEDTAYLLERSMELYESTGGAFDIAIYPVMQAWGFPTGEYRVPGEEELNNLLPLTDLSKVHYQKGDKTISLEEGCEIDLGGIAKGYTSSRIMDIYRECGVTSGMLNLGGNAQVMGSKPDGTAWKVGIVDPEDENGYLGILATTDRAVITSGGYERYFEKDGVTYHHIIDPATGYPAESGLLSVSIISADGTLADGLSTSLFVMGKEKAIAYWREHSEEFDTILETEDGELYVTESIAEDFQTDRECHTVTVENEN